MTKEKDCSKYEQRIRMVKGRAFQGLEMTVDGVIFMLTHGRECKDHETTWEDLEGNDSGLKEIGDRARARISKEEKQ